MKKEPIKPDNTIQLNRFTRGNGVLPFCFAFFYYFPKTLTTDTVIERVCAVINTVDAITKRRVNLQLSDSTDLYMETLA